MQLGVVPDAHAPPRRARFRGDGGDLEAKKDRKWHRHHDRIGTHFSSVREYPGALVVLVDRPYGCPYVHRVSKNGRHPAGDLLIATRHAMRGVRAERTGHVAHHRDVQAVRADTRCDAHPRHQRGQGPRIDVEVRDDRHQAVSGAGNGGSRGHHGRRLCHCLVRGGGTAGGLAHVVGHARVGERQPEVVAALAQQPVVVEHELRTAFDRGARVAGDELGRPHPPADPVTRLEHDYVVAGRLQVGCRTEPGEAGTHHRHPHQLPPPCHPAWAPILPATTAVRAKVAL
jgi:hypothetical protein